MEWGFIEDNWTQMRGNVRSQWGRLTDSQFDAIGGRRELLVRALRATYGLTRDEADSQIRVFENRQMDFRA
jgi:uncharacterized protein YjbJ (UPF0337 family)